MVEREVLSLRPQVEKRVEFSVHVQASSLQASLQASIYVDGPNWRQLMLPSSQGGSWLVPPSDDG